MNYREFGRRVHAGAKTIDEYYLAIAIKAVEGREGYYAKDVAEIIHIAASLQMSSSSQEKKQAVHAGLRDVIDSDGICDRLEPTIRAIRKQLFHSEEPPFPGTKSDPVAGIPKIGEWLQAHSIRPQGHKTVDHALQVELVTDLRGLTGQEVRIEWPVLGFPQKNRTTGKWESSAIALPVDSLAYPLYREIKTLSETGFSEASLTAWIFSGLRPVIPRMQIFSGMSWMHLMPAPRRFTRITINSPDVTWDELLEVYRSIRSQANVKRRKVHPLHERIYQIVRDRGGVPMERKTEFWESIRIQLKKEKGKNIPTRWEAIRKAYMATIRRTDSRRAE